VPRPDPIPGPSRAAIRRFRRSLSLVALFALAVAGLALVLVSSADAEWRIHMMIATGLGIFLTVFLAGALMLLIFLSASSGHDDAAARNNELKDDE
jgi:hypothetical protein